VYKSDYIEKMMEYCIPKQRYRIVFWNYNIQVQKYSSDFNELRSERNGVGFAHGNGLVYRPDFLAVNGFDELYYGYSPEDDDFNQRIIANGGNILYTKQIESCHIYHTANLKIEHEKNMNYYHAKGRNWHKHVVANTEFDKQIFDNMPTYKIRDIGTIRTDYRKPPRTAEEILKALNEFKTPEEIKASEEKPIFYRKKQIERQHEKEQMEKNERLKRERSKDRLTFRRGGEVNVLTADVKNSKRIGALLGQGSPNLAKEILSRHLAGKRRFQASQDWEWMWVVVATGQPIRLGGLNMPR
jgi:predicted Zn-dependent peptidase